MQGWILALAVLVATGARATPQWLTLPPTPTLPAAEKSGYAPVDGVRIWYAEYGKGEPVMFLHGGLGNSAYWGGQVRAVTRAGYRAIVMDSRGHGRSTRNAQPFGYDLMATDALAVLDYLKIKKVALVGWSDGAIVGLDIAMRHPERLSKLFAFAANYDPAGVLDVQRDPIFHAFVVRAGKEYAKLSSTPRQYGEFVAQISNMWNTQPRWTKEDFRRITTPTWIADGDHDEAIAHDQPRTMADWIPGAGLLIEPDVSHFAFLQDPGQFNRDLLHFLKKR